MNHSKILVGRTSEATGAVDPLALFQLIDVLFKQAEERKLEKVKKNDSSNACSSTSQNSQ